MSEAAARITKNAVLAYMREEQMREGVGRTYLLQNLSVFERLRKSYNSPGSMLRAKTG